MGNKNVKITEKYSFPYRFFRLLSALFRSLSSSDSLSFSLDEYDWDDDESSSSSLPGSDVSSSSDDASCFFDDLLSSDDDDDRLLRDSSFPLLLSPLLISSLSESEDPFPFPCSGSDSDGVGVRGFLFNFFFEARTSEPEESRPFLDLLLTFLVSFSSASDPHDGEDDFLLSGFTGDELGLLSSGFS